MKIASEKDSVHHFSYNHGNLLSQKGCMMQCKEHTGKEMRSSSVYEGLEWIKIIYVIYVPHSIFAMSMLYLY